VEAGDAEMKILRLSGGQSKLVELLERVMTTAKEPLVSRVEASYRKLSAVASDLNFTSDELGKSISELDSALKKLNLGVSVWVTVRHEDNPDNGWFRAEELGYDKIDGTWGIGLRIRSGEYNDPSSELSEWWRFNEGPRSLRLSAIEDLPELMEELSSAADETAKKIRSRLAEVQEVAGVIKKAAEEPVKRIIARGAEREQKK
jgi:hypothetical protein